MSRSKRFVTGLLSSYAAIGVNLTYTIASVPLALHYLDKKEFGIWALVTQISGYLMLLEFGMNGSVSRALSDHKDHIEDGIYGSVLLTGGRVFAIQGSIVTFAGLILAWLAPQLLNLPEHLRNPFSLLMAVQAVLSGIKLAGGTLTAPLWCHQRLDISNLGSSLCLIASFIALWIGFHQGWQLNSLILANAASTAIGLGVPWFYCKRLGFYPPRQYRGKFDRKIFHSLFHFGGGLFLMNLGMQLASASQVIVVSRMLGMEAAAIWAIATKMSAMATYFVGRVLDASAGGLAEMLVRKESDRLQKRFHDLVSISAVMAVAASAGIALANGAFVEVWTSGKVSWAPWNHYLLACVLFTTAMTRCHTILVGITKEIRGMKFAYLLEGVTFVVLAVLLVRVCGLTGVLIAALVCNLGITFTYGIRRTAGYFGIQPRAVAGWITRPATILIGSILPFSVTLIPAIAELGAVPRLVIGVMTYGVFVVPVLWLFGLPRPLRIELTQRLHELLKNARSRFRTA